MLMRVNIRCHICLSFLNLYLRFINDQIMTLRAYNKRLSTIILHRCCHLVVYNRSCGVPPTVPVHFTKSEVHERRSIASQGTLTTAAGVIKVRVRIIRGSN